MNKEIEYWKWKNTIIDFNAISDEKIDCNSWYTKKDWIFQYLGCPDERIHEWYNGGFSCEYNTALRYAKEFGLVEDYIDYEDEIYTLKQENEKLNHYKLLYQKVKDRNEKAIEILDRVDYEYSSRTELFNIVLETNEILKGNNETD